MIHRPFLIGKGPTHGTAMTAFSCLHQTASKTHLLLFMLLLVFTQTVLAASGDDDSGGSGTDTYERSQRLELLRSHSPTAPTSSTSGTRSRYLDSDPGYRYQPTVPPKPRRAPIESETARPRYTAPSHNEPSQLRTVSDERARDVVRRPVSGKRASHNTNIKAGTRPRKSAAVEVPVKPQKSAGTGPRCGFCLVNGYVYCGGQSVSLRQLVEQDRREGGTKHPHKKKKRGTHRHSSAKGPKSQKKAASVRTKKTGQRR